MIMLQKRVTIIGSLRTQSHDNKRRTNTSKRKRSISSKSDTTGSKRCWSDDEYSLNNETVRIFKGRMNSNRNSDAGILIRTRANSIDALITDDYDDNDDDEDSMHEIGSIKSYSALILLLFNSCCAEAFAEMQTEAGEQQMQSWQMGVPTEEATPLQNVFGFLFTVFCGWYFWRVVKKRGKRAQTFRVATQLSKEELKANEEERKEKDKQLTASQAFSGGITGILISTALYVFAVKVSTGFDKSTLPESYTARQISITVRTIVEGIVYLATFVYAANGVGLTLLGFKKLKNKYFDVTLEDALGSSSSSSPPTSENDQGGDENK